MTVIGPPRAWAVVVVARLRVWQIRGKAVTQPPVHRAPFVLPTRVILPTCQTPDPNRFSHAYQRWCSMETTVV
jgi:hypothetical protein